MKLIQSGIFRLCFSTIVLIKIKTRYIFKKAVPKAFKKYRVPATCEGFVASLKNLQYNFPKMRGGVKGCLELFRKFIRFGDGICPIVLMFLDHQCRQTLTFTSVVLCSATASLGCVEQPGDLNGSFLDILTWISILMFGIFIIWVQDSPSVSC